MFGECVAGRARGVEVEGKGADVLRDDEVGVIERGDERGRIGASALRRGDGVRGQGYVVGSRPVAELLESPLPLRRFDRHAVGAAEPVREEHRLTRHAEDDTGQRTRDSFRLVASSTARTTASDGSWF
jgi:hypothetical protein